MDPILGIDLGTTNSLVSIIDNGKAVPLADELGETLLPSVVGFDSSGRLLIGKEARNQIIVAPERTVKSIKRQMGETTAVRLGESEYTPQEISAMILRQLKARAEKSLGRACAKAVITVPAFFNDNQRRATREAGELAGLEVLRIINEPTAATLVYEPHTERNEKVLVYDLGGGTFDVSIVQIEQGVVEVLASHGDTQLGGDDFDQLLLDHLADRLLEQEGFDLRTIPPARSRMLQAAEEAKKRLSFEAFTSIQEEFIAERDGKPVHVNLEIDRVDYENLIEPLVKKTIKCVDEALLDAKLSVGKIDRVLLVGGSTRTPMVQRMLREQLGQEPLLEVDPDLCVSLGAAVQGGLIAGVDVGAVLVDITPHTLGIRCLGELYGRSDNHAFSPIIPRNTPLPAVRSETYYTCVDGQPKVEINVYQGEHEDTRYNQEVGSFMVEGLDREAESGSEVVVRFELNLDGILTTKVVERDTGLERVVVIDNGVTRFKAKSRTDALERLSTLMPDVAPSSVGSEVAQVGAALPGSSAEGDAGEQLARVGAATSRGIAAAEMELIQKARRLAPNASPEDATEIRALVEQLQTAAKENNAERVSEVAKRLEDVVFYLQDN